MILTPLLLAASAIPSSPDLGKAAGQCRPGENTSAFLVDVTGLKDRKGRLKLELYPANDADFLADDNVLVAAGKAFARVETGVPATGPVSLCIRAPGPGTYALTVLHDRDSNRRFAVSTDGIGFAGNPRLGLSKPSAAAASAPVGEGPTHLSIRMNYRKGLFSFGPLER
ncbi:DUF2141 domain-containing protein [Sphingobium sp. HWE2-09]|uniref:DUF2141 domain-containing protein n=1 Tax=Sphingobium sp. HWE2-09 TaxID=3108390 RepID=UPI002DC26D50|nr:DUF2141 domain-containing protein [Sphingobium sp. HWE2-09]